MSCKVESVWDYSENAKFYEYRPNYPQKLIGAISRYAEISNGENPSVADIGAGTGNLTVLLLNEKIYNVTAIEPNDAMRSIGELRTRDFSVKWVKATSIETTLPEGSQHWVTFGSSFNVADRRVVLTETARILRNGGYFTCMWNHRDLSCPVQQSVERIVESLVPGYERGVRREDQRPFLEKNADGFKDICYFEADFSVERDVDSYIMAWKSVKNRFWDLKTEEGKALFLKITDEIRKELPQNFNVQYTSRAWTMQKCR